MLENARLGGCLDEIVLDFVEREATLRLLIKLSIQLHLARLYFSNTVLFSIRLVSIVLDQRFTIGFTRPSYSPETVADRIT